MADGIKSDLAKLFINLLLDCKGYPKRRGWPAALARKSALRGRLCLLVSLIFLVRSLFILIHTHTDLDGCVFGGEMCWEVNMRSSLAQLSW